MQEQPLRSTTLGLRAIALMRSELLRPEESRKHQTAYLSVYGNAWWSLLSRDNG